MKNAARHCRLYGGGEAVRRSAIATLLANSVIRFRPSRWARRVINGRATRLHIFAADEDIAGAACAAIMAAAKARDEHRAAGSVNYEFIRYSLIKRPLKWR